MMNGALLRQFRLLVPTLILTACTTRMTKISIERGASTDNLVFEVGSGPGSSPLSFGSFRVDRCDLLLRSRGVFPQADSAAWIVDPVPGEASLASTIRYAHAPDGYRDLRPAQHLGRPGCYVAMISGTGVVGFEIDARGSVRELSEDELHRRALP